MDFEVGGDHAIVDLGDLIDGGDNLPVEPGVEGGHDVKLTVKMKLQRFLKDDSMRILMDRLGKVVQDGNVLMAEAYAFANFHILRCLSYGLDIPMIDRNFYNRCLLSVSDGFCYESTLPKDLSDSMTQFDALRENTGSTTRPRPSRKRMFDTNPSSLHKIDRSEYNQVIASLSIQMATMATNSLLSNLESRLEHLLMWKYPRLKRFHKAIVRAVVSKPSEAAEKILEASSLYKTRGSKRKTKLNSGDVDKDKEENIQKEATHRSDSLEIIKHLRSLMPLARPVKFASQSHNTLKLYYWILKETEDAKEVHLREHKGDENPPRFKGRVFNLLPMKNGFTTSFIPISSMAFFRILKSSGLSDHEGDGRHADKRSLWQKFCKVSLVETKNRKFEGAISTDGYSVSISISSMKMMDVRRGSTDSTVDEINKVIEECHQNHIPVRYGGGDPGFTDVVVSSYSNSDSSVSYSSSRYYEKAKIKYSQRVANNNNKNTKTVTDALLASGGSKTSYMNKLSEYIRLYLQAVKDLLADRMEQTYRKMRFLRHIHKGKAITEIVDALVGKSDAVGMTVFGFGDWSGGSKSPISRKCSGPWQSIKHEIGRRKNAMIKPVDEHKSSQLCCEDWSPLKNMRATTVRKKKDGSSVEMLRQKVHKVLHCQPSDGLKNTLRQKTTWNRDENASKNILMLLRMELKGYKRPSPFQRSLTKPTNVGTEAGIQKGDVVANTPTNPVILCPLRDH